MGAKQSNVLEQSKIKQFFTEATRDELQNKRITKTNKAEERQMHMYMEEEKSKFHDLTNAYIDGEVDNLHVASISEKRIENSLANARRKLADRHRQQKKLCFKPKDKEAKKKYQGYMDNIKSGGLRNRLSVRSCVAAEQGSCLKHFNMYTLERAQYIINNRPKVLTQDLQRRKAVNNEIGELMHKKKTKGSPAAKMQPPWMRTEVKKRNASYPRRRSHVALEKVKSEGDVLREGACAREAASAIARNANKKGPEDSVEMWLVAQKQRALPTFFAQTTATDNNRASFQTILDDLRIVKQRQLPLAQRRYVTSAPQDTQRLPCSQSAAPRLKGSRRSAMQASPQVTGPRPHSISIAPLRPLRYSAPSQRLLAQRPRSLRSIRSMPYLIKS